MKGYKMAVVKEVKRQSNEYGKLMLLEMDRNRPLAMFYHDCIANLYEISQKAFKLKLRDFGRPKCG